MEQDLIKLYDPLIKSISNKFYGVEKDELYQVGLIGLYEAYKNYDNESETKFSTYAYKYIFGQMYNLSMKYKIIKHSKETLKLIKLIEKTKNYLTQLNNRIPSISEIAQYLKINEYDINQALESTKIVSLDKEQEEDTTLYNILESKQKDIDLSLDLNDSLNNLDEMSKKIIKMRYYDNYTQQEIADKLGISQVKVSREESKSLKKLKLYMV